MDLNECKDLHMAHKTSCPFFGMRTGSTLDTPQSHSSKKRKEKKVLNEDDASP